MWENAVVWWLDLFRCNATRLGELSKHLVVEIPWGLDKPGKSLEVGCVIKDLKEGIMEVQAI